MFAVNKNTISTTKLHIDTFKSRFENSESISVSDILSFYRKYDNKVKKSTVSWRIYNLVDKGVIQRIGKGKYKLGKQKKFKPLEFVLINDYKDESFF